MSRGLIEALPKVHLHLHLEGAVRFSTLEELLPGEAQPEGGETLAEATLCHFCIVEPVSSLTECMDRFSHLQRVFSSPDIVERIAYEVVEDAAAENVVALEMRYSPTYISQGHDVMTISQVHDAVVRGVERAKRDFPDVAVGLIAILDRFQTPEEADAVLDLVLEHRDAYVGVDLANDEVTMPDAIFEDTFARAREHGLGVTIHCGEIDDPRSPGWVQRAVDTLGATRIGHGIHVMRDTEVVKAQAAKGTVFEVCVTSNVLIGATAGDASTHPVRRMLDAGLACTFSTDDPGLFHISLQSELACLMDECGVSWEEVVAAQRVALDASFLPDHVKASVLARVGGAWG